LFSILLVVESVVANISVQHLVKDFSRADHGTLQVIGDLTFDVRDGEFISILGPSGCGKSTLLSILAGLDQPSGGEILVNGKPLLRNGNQTRLGFVFQQPRLLNWRSVRRNVLLPLERSALSKEEQQTLSSRYLELVRLNGFEDYFPLQLSGGMQARVAIARALAVDPDVLLMDEPFSSLDELNARKMRAELIRIWQETKKTIIFVTHDISEAVFLSNRLLVVTERPTRVFETLDIDVGYPRDYDDDRLFELSKKVSRIFLTMEDRHDN
jgi:ABC-type nitrate/sulfonate/bicarbonate transport system ATPase subunit